MHCRSGSSFDRGGVQMRGTRVRRLGAGLIACAVIAAGCGGSDESGSGGGSTTSGGGQSAGVKAAAAAVEQYRAVPDFQAPGKAFDARKAAKVKWVMSITASSAVPFVQTLHN